MNRVYTEGRRMAGTVFDKGAGTGNAVAAGQTSLFGTMKNRSNQKPGIPLAWGYRPVDRPMGNYLGKRVHAENVDLGFGNSSRVPDRKKDPTFFRRQVAGVKVFSWEK